MEDFCAYFKPVIETRPRLFLKVFKRICEVEEISFKKLLTKDKDKFEQIKQKFDLKTPNNDFVFRKIWVVKLVAGVQLDQYNIDPLKSASTLVLVLYKDIMFKLNKKAYLCKTLSG